MIRGKKKIANNLLSAFLNRGQKSRNKFPTKPPLARPAPNSPPAPRILSSPAPNSPPASTPAIGKPFSVTLLLGRRSPRSPTSATLLVRSPSSVALLGHSPPRSPSKLPTTPYRSPCFGSRTRSSVAASSARRCDLLWPYLTLIRREKRAR